MDRSNLPIVIKNGIVKILCEKLVYPRNVLVKKIGLPIKNPNDQPKLWLTGVDSTDISVQKTHLHRMLPKLQTIGCQLRKEFSKYLLTGPKPSATHKKH